MLRNGELISAIYWKFKLVRENECFGDIKKQGRFCAKGTQDVGMMSLVIRNQTQLQVCLLKKSFFVGRDKEALWVDFDLPTRVLRA